jgi:hypothetical protein
MAATGAPPASDMNSRIDALERELRSLRLRVAELERQLGVRRDRPDDQATIVQKVTYDWQK